MSLEMYCPWCQQALPVGERFVNHPREHVPAKGPLYVLVVETRRCERCRVSIERVTDYWVVRADEPKA